MPTPCPDSESTLSAAQAERLPPGTIVFLRLRVQGHDPEHFTPICCETIGSNGTGSTRPMPYWVRPEDIITAAEAIEKLRKAR